MTKMQGFYFGTIVEVLPPESSRNSSKYQTEYQVLITADEYAQIPCRCIRMDPYGSFHNFEDAILAVGYVVFVMFPKGDPSLGVIVGGTRKVSKPQLGSDGYHYRHRFNEIEMRIDSKGALTWVSDDGPVFTLNKTIIRLDDSAGDTITLDKASKTITISCQEWKVEVKGRAVINVTGDAQLAVGGNLTANVTKDASVQCANAKLKAEKEAKVESGGDCEVKAKTIKLNGSSGKVLTTASDPILCPITGMPAKGVSSVKAG